MELDPPRPPPLGTGAPVLKPASSALQAAVRAGNINVAGGGKLEVGTQPPHPPTPPTPTTNNDVNHEPTSEPCTTADCQIIQLCTLTPGPAIRTRTT